MKHLDYLKLLTNPLAGGSGGGGGDEPTGTVDIVSNGTANVAAYAEANVAVPGGLYNGQAFDPIPANAVIAQALTTRRDTELAGMHPGQTNVHSGNVSLDLTIARGDYLIVTGTTTPSEKSFVLAGVVTSVNQFPTYQYARMTLRFVIIDNAGKMTITSPGWYDLRGYELAEVSGGGGGGDATLRGLLDGSLAGVLSDDVVTSLRPYACEAMTGLTGANFPEVTQIGDNAFYGCTSLANVSFPKLVSLGVRAFQNCTALLDSVFPLLKTIGDYAFYECGSLTKVNATYFPGLSASGAYIGSDGFYSCDHLTEVDLPATVNRLLTSCFQYCGSLSYVKFLGTRLSSYVFDGCQALATVLVPNLTSFDGNNSFRGCTSLETIDLPALVTIRQGTFDACTSLEKVIFGAHVATVPAQTFINCSSLKYVLFGGATSVPTLSNTNAFQGTPIASGTGYIYVPDSLLTTWKAASNWSTYANQIKGIKAWAAGSYDVDDIVINDGHYYICIASTASSPWTGPWDNTYWADFGVVA